VVVEEVLETRGLMPYLESEVLEAVVVHIQLQQVVMEQPILVVVVVVVVTGHMARIYLTLVVMEVQEL
jgi:hypothetical protein